MLKWFKGVPKKPGIYLRNNPAAMHIMKHDVFYIMKDLCINNSQGRIVRLKNWHGAKDMLWYGPIPKIPKALKNE